MESTRYPASIQVSEDARAFSIDGGHTWKYPTIYRQKRAMGLTEIANRDRRAAFVRDVARIYLKKHDGQPFAIDILSRTVTRVRVGDRVEQLHSKKALRINRVVYRHFIRKQPRKHIVPGIARQRGEHTCYAGAMLHALFDQCGSMLDQHADMIEALKTSRQQQDVILYQLHRLRQAYRAIQRGEKRGPISSREVKAFLRAVCRLDPKGENWANVRIGHDPAELLALLERRVFASQRQGHFAATKERQRLRGIQKDHGAAGLHERSQHLPYLQMRTGFLGPRNCDIEKFVSNRVSSKRRRELPKSIPIQIERPRGNESIQLKETIKVQTRDGVAYYRLSSAISRNRRREHYTTYVRRGGGQRATWTHVDDARSQKVASESRMLARLKTSGHLLIYKRVAPSGKLRHHRSTKPRSTRVARTEITRDARAPDPASFAKVALALLFDQYGRWFDSNAARLVALRRSRQPEDVVLHQLSRLYATSRKGVSLRAISHKQITAFLGAVQALQDTRRGVGGENWTDLSQSHGPAQLLALLEREVLADTRIPRSAAAAERANLRAIQRESEEDDIHERSLVLPYLQIRLAKGLTIPGFLSERAQSVRNWNLPNVVPIRIEKEGDQEVEVPEIVEVQGALRGAPVRYWLSSAVVREEKGDFSVLRRVTRRGGDQWIQMRGTQSRGITFDERRQRLLGQRGHLLLYKRVR